MNTRVSFGHEALATCEYCHSFGDFALYAFPGPLLEYIREIAFVGVSQSFSLYLKKPLFISWNSF
jgi:hypothetical protein